MYHAHHHGTHYAIGFRWGALLRNGGNFILENIGFPITPERMAFSDACLPIYQEYFPEILDEIRGAAAGQGCDEAPLRAFLCSMYAMPPSCHCSCFAVSNGSHILLGRNSDFLTALEKSNLNVIYRFTSPAYSFTGNTTAFIQMEDGVNEQGLAVGLTAVQPAAIAPGFNAGLLLRYLLEKCISTREAIEAVQRLPISSAQTFTVADASGEIAVVECCCERVSVLHPSTAAPYVCATNRFHAASMTGFHVPDTDDWQAQPRYETLVRALDHHAGDLSPETAMELLAGKHGFLCQYDRHTGRDTVWATLYDLTGQTIFRTEGNPARRKFREDTRFRILK